MDDNSSRSGARVAAAGAGAQEFVRATVHLAGAVEIETGHAAHYSAMHVQARIGSVLLYFLDYTAASDFAAAVHRAASLAGTVFPAPVAGRLPAQIGQAGQESSLIVRLRGRQTAAQPQAATAAGSPHGQPFISCQVGGLVLVAHTPEALDRLVRVAATAERVAAAIWPEGAAQLRDGSARDEYAEQWERVHGPR